MHELNNMADCKYFQAASKTDDLDLLHRSTARQCDIKPYYFVLEIGFRKGHGLQEVLNIMKGGSGRLVGTEMSNSFLDKVTNQLQDDIATGTLELELCAPESLTFIPNMFDCVYNVNGFYYWDDISKSVAEIYRVLRPGCLFLTCVHKNEKLSKREIQEIKHPSTRIQEYADTLKEHGFVKIKILEHRNAHSGFKYQTVHAYSRSRK